MFFNHLNSTLDQSVTIEVTEVTESEYELLNAYAITEILKTGKMPIKLLSHHISRREIQR